MTRSNGSAVGGTEPAVAAHHAHVVDAGRAQVLLGLGGDLVVEVDAHHATGRADEVREQPRVVAGARADLEHAHARAGRAAARAWSP